MGLRGGSALSAALSFRATLASTSLIDLLFRVGTTLQLRSLETLYRGLGSITAGTLTLTVTGWGVFVAGYLVFAPRLYPSLQRSIRDRPSFRGLFAVVSLGFALLVTQSVVGSLLVRLLLGSVWLVLGALGFAVYFTVVIGWPLLEPTATVFEPLAQFFPEGGLQEDVESDLAREGLLGYVGAGLWVLAFGIFFAFPCFVVGIVTLVLQLTFPVPDLLALTYLAGTIVSDGQTPRVPPLFKETETRLYAVAALCTRSIHGMGLGTLTGIGVMLSVATVGIAVDNATQRVVTVSQIASQDPLAASVLFGVPVTLFGVGTYGLWFWLREIRRLGAYLQRWEDAEPTIALVVRPRWLTGPPAAVIIVLTVVLATPRASPVRTAFALMWPLSLGCLLVIGYETRRRTARAPTREHLAIGTAVFLQAVGLWVAFQLDALRTTLQTATIGAFNPLFLVVAGLTVVLMTSLGLTRQYSETRAGWSRYAFAGFLFVCGCCFLLSARLTATYRLPLRLAGGVCLIGALSLAVVKWRRL